MRHINLTSSLLGALMLASAAGTHYITSNQTTNQITTGMNLESIVPREFDQWKIDPNSELRLINPDTQGKQYGIYNQTIARTYINRSGQRIMLSVAYGSDQRSDLQVHRPEICYTAGGFTVNNFTKTRINTDLGEIPVMHLVATQGNRVEPITYWIRVGDSLTRGWIQQKLTAIAYGMTGNNPDGLLFRVSSISKNEQDAYVIQRDFTNAMLKAVHSDDRHWLIGHQIN